MAPKRGVLGLLGAGVLVLTRDVKDQEDAGVPRRDVFTMSIEAA